MTIRSGDQKTNHISIKRLLVLLLIIFSGLGMRVMQFEGAIIVWAFLISCLNIRELLRINVLLLTVSCGVLISLFVVFFLKGAAFRNFMAAVVYCSYVFLLPYCQNPKLLYQDFKVLLDIFMRWNIVSIAVMILFEPYLKDLLFGFDSYKAFFYIFWFVPFGGPDIYNGMRPCGITWEPGIWQMFLNLNFLFAIFEERSKKYIIISLLSVVLVFSTTGIIMLLVCLLISVLSRTSNAGLVRRILIPISVLPFIPIMFNNVSEKISGKHMGSGMTRVSDFFTGWFELLKNPVLGSTQENMVASLNSELVGIKSFFWAGNFYDGSYVDYLDVANCNGYMIFLVEWGLIIGLPLLYLTFNTKVFPSKRTNLGALAIIYISMSSEPISNTAFFYSLVIMGGVSTNRTERFTCLKHFLL